MAIKKEKSSNPNTPGRNITNRVTEDRLKFYEIYGNPIPDNVLDDLCQDLREWADKKSSLRFKDFLNEKRIEYKMFKDFMQRHEGLRKEHQWTLDKIASRRELGVGTFRLHPLMARMLSHYDAEWTENEEKLAKIKRLSQSEGNTGQTIIAVIPEVPHSNLVPERNNNE